MKRIVVFFPSWRYFGHFALPLFEPLAKEFDIIFFHSEKAIYGWDDCPDLSDKGIQTVDLKSLKTFSMVKAVKRLTADCVVVFDKGWVQDRAVLQAAKKIGIPSLHIQHGIIAQLEEVKTKKFFTRAIGEFIKVVRTLLLYNRTMLQVGLLAWMRSLPFQSHLLMNPNHYYYNARHETTADLACIIGARDKGFFIGKEGYREDQLVPLGALQFEAAYAMEQRKPNDRLLLVTQPMFEDHVLEGGLDAKKDHIQQIIDRSPLPVAIKPHPRESVDWYRENFQSSELYMFPQDMNINEAILNCSHVVGYFSTALINALILNRPVGIIRWVDNHAYVLDLDGDGNAVTLNSPDQLIELTDAESCDVTERYAYNRNVIEGLKSSLTSLLQ